MVIEGGLPPSSKLETTFMEVREPKNAFWYQNGHNAYWCTSENLHPNERVKWEFRHLDDSTWDHSLTGYSVAPLMTVQVSRGFHIFGRFHCAKTDSDRLGETFREYELEWFATKKTATELFACRNTGHYPGIDTWSPGRMEKFGFSLTQRFWLWLGWGVNVDTVQRDLEQELAPGIAVPRNTPAVTRTYTVSKPGVSVSRSSRRRKAS